MADGKFVMFGVVEMNSPVGSKGRYNMAILKYMDVATVFLLEVFSQTMDIGCFTLSVM